MKMKRYYILSILFVFALVLFFSDISFAQCSMCQKIASDGANSKTAANSLNSGILYLMAIPYCMIAFIFRKQIRGLILSIRGHK